MTLAADESVDLGGYGDSPGDHNKGRTLLTQEDLNDNSSDLSDVGRDEDEDEHGPPRPTKSSDDRLAAAAAQDRDRDYKTSADVNRERRDAGQSSIDPTYPDYSQTRMGASAPAWRLSRATSSNASTAASPGSAMRAPSRPKGTGMNLDPTAVPRKLGNGHGRVSGSRSPSSSLIGLNSVHASPPPLPRVDRKTTRSMDKQTARSTEAKIIECVEINSSPPPAPFKSKVAAGSSKTRKKTTIARTRSSDDEEKPASKRKDDSAVSSSRSTRRNIPVPSTAQATARRLPGGSSTTGLQNVEADWNPALAKSKRLLKEQRYETKATDDRYLEEKSKIARKTQAVKGKRFKGQDKPSQAIIPSSEVGSDISSAVESSDEERKPKKPRSKPQVRRAAKLPSPSPPPAPKGGDMMAQLLSKSRLRQAQADEKQRADEEKERERYAREGPAVLTGGPMAMIRAAGGLGALRAIGPTTSFSGNAVAGPSSQSRSRAASNASSTSSLTSLESLLSESEDEMALGAAPSKTKLCPYCSEPLPARQTKKLKKLFQRLERRSVAMPTSINPGARSLPISRSSVVCALHRSESVLIPEGVRMGYPLRIDWLRTIERVREHEKALLEVIRRKDSVFWEFAKERTGEVGKGVSRSARGQFDVFEKCQPGYFGEIGQILFHQTLVDMFSRPPAPVLTSAICNPLTASDFIYWVLIPELAILLIQEDLGVSYREAFEAMKDSREFGLSVFGVEEGEQSGGALMEGWDENAEEVASGDERGITILRRKLNKSVQHRKSKTSQRASGGFPAYDPKAFDRAGGPAGSGPASSQTARAGNLRTRSPPVIFSSSQLSASSTRPRTKRKEVDPMPEPEPIRKKPKPKPRLAPSSSMQDLLSSGSSAPQGLLSQDAMRNDVARVTLDTSPADPSEVVVTQKSHSPPHLEADDTFDDLADFILD